MKQYPTCFNMLSKTVFPRFCLQKDILGLCLVFHLQHPKGRGNASALYPAVELWAKCTLHSGVLTTFLPSRGLTYPTLGKGKSSSKCHFWGICGSWDFSGWWQLKHFLLFTPKFGEDEPNLTSIFFNGVGSTTNQFLKCWRTNRNQKVEVEQFEH